MAATSATPNTAPAQRNRWPALHRMRHMTAFDAAHYSMARMSELPHRPRPRPRGLGQLLPPDGADPDALPLLVARGMRALGDGYMAVLLPAYLLAIGLGTLEVGLVSTATMLGSSAATLAVGAWGHRFASNRLMKAAALLMAATGLGFASLASFIRIRPHWVRRIQFEWHAFFQL